MRNITLVFFVLFFAGCSSVEYPDCFVESIIFSSDIIDIEKMQIKSKDELIEFVDITDSYYCDYYQDDELLSCPPDLGNRANILRFNARLEQLPYDYEYVVYVKPLSNEKPILDKKDYELGMPISLRSKQPVILIKGKQEWADSSYNGFTILPVADSNDTENSLDFTWIIKKQKSLI